jgi:hypothetical protein
MAGSLLCSESPLTYRYRAEVLAILWAHGVQPTTSTPPELVHEFVSDLYRYEIRRLRARLLRREFPKHTYADQVIELRRKYPLISLQPRQWLVGGE